MATVVGVRIKNTGKIFYFDPCEVWPRRGDKVIVETMRGLVMGSVITGLKKIPDEMCTMALKPIIRIANAEDMEKQAELDKYAQEAASFCREKIAEHDLDMKLVRVEPMLDNSKLMFYFTASQRIDFRNLVKDLANKFKMRIELRQIGARDEAKIIGTLGMCGRATCCSKFLGDFEPVSIKMAKEQMLSLNPLKISGVCGRLMCCLKYEHEFYEEALKKLPKLGKYVQTPEGTGLVVELNALSSMISVKLEKENQSEIKWFTLEQIQNPQAFIKNEETIQSVNDYEDLAQSLKQETKQNRIQVKNNSHKTVESHKSQKPEKSNGTKQSKKQKHSKKHIEDDKQNKKHNKSSKSNKAQDWKRLIEKAIQENKGL